MRQAARWAVAAMWWVGLGGCSLLQDPSAFTFVSDGGRDASAARDADARCVVATDCGALPRAVVGCVDGACVVAGCEAGFADCDAAPANGCEVDTATDEANCGGCGARCAPANAVGVCAASACAVETCVSGFNDCNSDASDGCEADLRTPATCGSCDLRCVAPTGLCDATGATGRCLEECDVTRARCGDSCIDTARDVAHCGACDRACPLPANATPTCGDSVCGLACVGSFGDCNADATDGCEEDLATSTAHCGACGNACGGGNASWTCDGTACAVDACDPSFDDCNLDPTDGCEADLRTDAAHCGACDSPCSGTCVDGVCDPIVDVAGEREVTCAINASRDLFCWGYGRRSGHGLGDSGPRPLPEQVTRVVGMMPPAPVAARDVAVGSQHMCAVTMAGEILCAGRNQLGEAGQPAGSEIVQLTPVSSADARFASRTFASIDAGQSHTCAVDTLGDVWCWGADASGQSGGPGTGSVREAIQVTGIGGAAASVGAGSAHTCVRRVDETVRCWGSNSLGQVGAAAGTHPVRAPTDLGLTAVVSLGVGGNHACAANRAGELRCWGQGFGAANGSASEANLAAPTLVPGVSGVTEVYGGGSFTSIVDATGPGVFGSRLEGQLGDGSTTGFSAAVVRPAVGAAPRVLPIADGACAIDAGRLLCWGDNRLGQLGRDDTIRALTPRAVGGATPLPMVTAISAGYDSACAISAGAAYCWGLGINGQLGTGASRTSASPSRLVNLPLARAVGVGFQAACASDDLGAPFCWGADVNERLGTPGGSTNQPAAVSLSGPVDAIRPSLDHGCARVGGAVHCWGANPNGELGRGTFGGAPTATPAPVVGLSDAAQLAVGRGFNCARRVGGGAVCWGAGGRLGDGTGARSASPVAVATLSAVLDIAAADRQACAIEEGATPGQGQVYCWGDNSDGAVGDPASAGLHLAPFPVVGVSDAVAVAAGYRHSCAVRATGAVACWGTNLHGQLGDGTTTTRRAPAAVLSITDALDVTAGGFEGYTTCVRRSGAISASCWGSCIEGACGTGEALVRPSPAPVMGL